MRLPPLPLPHLSLLPLPLLLLLELLPPLFVLLYFVPPFLSLLLEPFLVYDLALGLVPIRLVCLPIIVVVLSVFCIFFITGLERIPA